jgi:hypothetical protein
MGKNENEGGKSWTVRSEMTHEQEIALTHDLPPADVVNSLLSKLEQSSTEGESSSEGRDR